MTNRKIINLLFSYTRPYKISRFFTVFITIINVIVGGFLGPWILAQIFNQLQTGDLTLAGSWSIVILYALAELYGVLIGWRVTLLLTWRFEAKVQTDMHNVVFDKLINESMDFHANKFGGSLVSQTNKFVGAFENLWDSLIWNVIPAFTTIIGTVVILSFYLWQYALIVLIISIIFITIVITSSKFIAKRNTAEAQASTKLTGIIADVIGNIAIVKSNSQEKLEAKRIKNQANIWRNKSLQVMNGVVLTGFAYGSLNSLLAIMAMIAAILASQYNWISIGLVYLILSYTMQLSRHLWSITQIVRGYYRVVGNAHDMAEILSTPTELVDKTTKKLLVKSGEIEFKNVSYKYQSGAGTHIFDDFTLTIKSGQKVGIVGASGSGKTSLTRILLRFSDIDAGEIRIDNQNIAKITQSSLHQAMSYVPQESSLFHRSLRDNIAYGKQNATDKQIIKAAKDANAWEFIKDLPESLDTLVGERGVKLSGGQRQRIAIARAILKNAPILVLDEATSALDSESEKLIQDSLDNLMKNRTSLVIAHRLSTIAKLDRIIVMDKGRIIEDGTHNQLLRKKGLYAKLWNRQSGGFIE